MKLFDTHTHYLRHDAWVNRAPGDILEPGYTYSVGVHPWDAGSFDLRALEEAARHDCVKAIGETGLDTLRGPSLDIQESVFREHVRLSEMFGKPLIIHCVKAFDRLMALKKEIKPMQPWIIHGFRGKPQQAGQLLRAGFHLSLGPNFNPETARVIPSDRLHIETDDSPVALEEVASAVQKALDHRQ